MIFPAIAILLFYSGSMALLLHGVAKASPVRPSGNLSRMPGVSIVIPFKNEARNLENLLASLASQRYDGPYEVILVNDCSTDNYQEVIAGLTQSFPFKVIDSAYSPGRKLSSKQQALDLGIRSASFEWVALTDADMFLSPGWLQSLLAATEGGAKLIFGHTGMERLPGNPVFGWLQAFQLDALFAVAYGLHRAGINGSCMGNNLLLSKKAYEECGGFDAIGYSMVEDRALLLALKKNGCPVAAATPFIPQAITLPCDSLNRYADQLLRWAKGGFGSRSNLTVFAVALACQNLACLGAAAGLVPLPVSLLAAGNFLATWLFITLAFRKTGSRLNGLLFPAFFPMLLLETLLLPAALISGRGIVWKGRRM
jgi:cellulose synthase/poly-beta-1,6-N-acetylglucosamine synthase-like glycosyltransferase